MGITTSSERSAPTFPSRGRQYALAFTRAKKVRCFAISFPLYLPRTAKSNSGRQLARSAGIQKGRSPFAHGGVRGIEECKHSSGKVFDFSTLIKFEAPFPFLRSKKTVPWRYKRRIFRGCIAWAVKRREKEAFAYNTEHSSKGHHHLIRRRHRVHA